MKSQLGMGTLVGMLFDDSDDTVKAVESSLGKVISQVSLNHDGNSGNGELHFVFEDNSELRLFDSGQTCCEHRYMHTDDDLLYFRGAILRNMEVSPVEESQAGQGYYSDYHETQFLTVHTSKGTFTVSTHNIHNGYYGGFWLQATLDC